MTKSNIATDRDALGSYALASELHKTNRQFELLLARNFDHRSCMLTCKVPIWKILLATINNGLATSYHTSGLCRFTIKI